MKHGLERADGAHSYAGQLPAAAHSSVDTSDTVRGAEVSVFIRSLYRMRDYKNTDPKIQLCDALVLSKLNYVDSVWSLLVLKIFSDVYKMLVFAIVPLYLDEAIYHAISINMV
ncbi:hypothetical protein EVAR_2855_1 [Eumeta japonica]|uniref:Uncharacterized protein n=1 Tax=Eumeta variegata TaxID=151549 RepID=A0A4C1T1I6_EUMVA|nr:hypothetical protein EVAR_2855_1 [Eumeta japonica]